MESSKHPASSQVWERVFQPPSQPAADFRPLMRTAAELAGIYQNLAGQLPRQERIRKLYEGERANLAALKGLAQLQGQAEEVLKSWNPGKKPPRVLLESAYRQSRRMAAEYLSRSAEPEYGVVFRELAQREERHCAWIAEVLGAGELRRSRKFCENHFENSSTSPRDAAEFSGNLPRARPSSSIPVGEEKNSSPNGEESDRRKTPVLR